ncbi:MAG: MarR family transcriptional regulator [Promethearchaeota archaeon]
MMENEPYIFEGKLHDFEQTIVEFLLVDAKMTGIDPNETLIYIYILLHRKLTQAQLAELTKFPKSKISKITSKMTIDKILSKQFIPGTHTNEYMLIQQPFEMNFVPVEQLIDNYDHQSKFFEDTIKDLHDLEGPKRGNRDLLSWRLYDMILYSRGRSQILKFNEENEEINKFDYQGINFDFIDASFREERLQYLSNLDKSSTFLIGFEEEEIQKIESEIIKYLLEHVIKEEKESINRIMAYFMTRGKLTQQSIQELTDFSSGTISQTLRYLLKEGKIDQIPTSRVSGNEYYYTMKSISLTLLKTRAAIYKDLIAWKPAFDDIKQQLNDHGNDLLFTDGYFSIYTVSDKILSIFFTKYEKYLNQHERLLEIHENSIFNVDNK